jgi:vacuolar-type H+-ATPase subunit I/STV1
MSDEISNTAIEATADTVEATAETVSGEKEKNYDLSSGGIKDRIGAALQKAVDAQPEVAEQKKQLVENATIDSLEEVNLPEGTHKGINYNNVVEALPEDAQKLLANMRSSYTKKTQELAAQRKELQMQMEALQNSKVYENISEVAQRETQLDPYDTETFNARIEEEVARRMQQMMKPMQEEYQLQQRKQKLDAWTAEHPDFKDYKTDIVELLKTNRALDLQSAYYIVKGKSQTEALKAQQAELKQYKDAARQYGLKVSAGNNVTSKRPPKGMKSYELYKWVKDNAAKR